MSALLLIVTAVAVVGLVASIPAPYRGCRRWAPRHRWTARHVATRAYRPRHRHGAVARPARLPLAAWALAGAR